MIENYRWLVNGTKFRRADKLVNNAKVTVGVIMIGIIGVIIVIN